MKVISGKQVGPVYYMVSSLDVLCKIILEKKIRSSTLVEPHNGVKEHFVSFLRDVTKASRNAKRWKYGVQIDGDKLSNRYSISPVSYAGMMLNRSKSSIRLKTLIEYDDGSFSVSFVNWPSILVPELVYRELEDLVVSDVQGINSIKKLEVSTGKRAYRGKQAIKKYNFNCPNGGCYISDEYVSPECMNYILKHTQFNESEERIWTKDRLYIDISDCISGILIPDDEDIDLEMYPELKGMKCIRF